MIWVCDRLELGSAPRRGCEGSRTFVPRELTDPAPLQSRLSLA